MTKASGLNTAVRLLQNPVFLAVSINRQLSRTVINICFGKKVINLKDETSNLGTAKKKWGGILPGTILILLGVIFLLNNYGFTSFDIGKLWPLFLIIPGIFMITGISKEH